MTQQQKILRNVFIPFKGNKLKLVNIVFTDTIQSIQELLPAPVAWEAIQTMRQKQALRAQLPEQLKKIKAHEIDGRFLLLMPAGIDAHVHFDTPGFEFREDFEHASLAALWGGVTTIIDMPCTSLPPVTSLPNMQTKLQAIQGRAFCDYAFWGGINGLDFEQPQKLKKQLTQLVEAGVVGFKAYLISGMETFTDLTTEQMKTVARWLKDLNAILAIHAEDKQLVFNRKNQLQQQGRIDWQAYCQARDVEAERTAVAFMHSIAQQTKAQIHIVHLSSKAGLQIIRQAQQQNLAMTAETCPHYLFFTQDDFNNPAIRNYLKTAPPVKQAIDRMALWQGLSDGSLHFVTTDHAGCNPAEEKTSANFWQVYGGIPGVEHRVPFLLSEGFLKGRLSLEQTVRLLSENVADFFHLKQKGQLQKGKDADFAVIDLWHSWKVSAANMHSKGKYTPFQDVTFKARVQQTYLRGQLVVDFEQQFQTSTPMGKFITKS